jgi:hypothetical protein
MLRNPESVQASSQPAPPGSILTSLLYIREVLGSNLGSETGYPEGFCGFPEPLQANEGQYLKIRPWPLPCKSFPINSRIILSIDAKK